MKGRSNTAINAESKCGAPASHRFLMPVMANVWHQIKYPVKENRSMQSPPLTQSVGSAERSMRALLERHLRDAGLSFPAWTALVFTNASPLTIEQVTQRQISGHIVSGADEARRAIDNLIATGLIVADENHLFMHTDKGSMLFKVLSAKVKDITQALYGDLPSADLEATHRTLLEIARRASSLLSSSQA